MTGVDRIKTDSEAVVIACPECDHAGDVINRRRQNTHAGDPDHPFVCGECSATFEIAVVRREKPRAGRAAKYGDLSVEDVGL